MNWRFYINFLVVVGLLTTPTSGCRSSVDTEREPILSHHGTEPPEPEHKKPSASEPKVSFLSFNNVIRVVMSSEYL